jgi:hypothetical protein
LVYLWREPLSLAKKGTKKNPAKNESKSHHPISLQLGTHLTTSHHPRSTPRAPALMAPSHRAQNPTSTPTPHFRPKIYATRRWLTCPPAWRPPAAGARRPPPWHAPAAPLGAPFVALRLRHCNQSCQHITGLRQYIHPPAFKLHLVIWQIGAQVLSIEVIQFAARSLLSDPVCSEVFAK